MTYKTIFRTLLMTMAVTASSCTFEQEDFFDESASLRITHTNEKIQNRLVEQSADGKHGWVIQYFVAGTDERDFPGYNLFGRFYKNGRVTLAGNHNYLRNGNANKYTEATSTYEMLSEEGPVLSFNTWNDVLTVFEDPVDPSSAPGSLSNNGEGMYGDHNLVLKELNDEDMIFRGERHSAQTRFIPCDRPWEDYIADTETMKSYITNSTINSYYVVNEAFDTLYFVGLRNGRFNFCERVDDPLTVTSLGCVFTPQGFRTEKEQTFGENTFQEFTIAEDSTCLVNEDNSIKVIACWDNYIINRTSRWKLDPEYFTAEQQTLYNQIAEELKVYNNAYDIEGLYLGQSTGRNAVSGLVVVFYTNSRRTSTNTAGIALNTQKTTFGQMSIEFSTNAVYDGNMENFSTRTNLGELTSQFAATLSGTYEIVPNNYFLPTGGIFNPINGGNTFKLN